MQQTHESSFKSKSEIEELAPDLDIAKEFIVTKVVQWN